MLTWMGFKRSCHGCLDYYTFGLSSPADAGKQQPSAPTRSQPQPASATTPQQPAADTAGGVGGCSNSHGSSGNASGGSSRPPLVLLHGVGMGLLPYFKLLLTLAAAGELADVCYGCVDLELLFKRLHAGICYTAAGRKGLGWHVHCTCVA